MTEQSFPVLIGIGGLLASGKDTVADYLVDHHGFIKMGMSEPLNEAMLALDPIVIVDEFVQYPEGAPGHGWNTPRSKMSYAELVSAVGYTKAKENPEVRRLLQALGTEVGRDMIDPEVWTNIAERKIIKAMSLGKSVILTGIRFPNERDMITHNQGTLVWVDRSAPDLVTPGGSPSGTYSTPQHSSENTLSARDFQVIMQNNETLDALYRLTRVTLAEILHNAVISRPSPRITDSTWPTYDH